MIEVETEQERTFPHFYPVRTGGMSGHPKNADVLSCNTSNNTNVHVDRIALYHNNSPIYLGTS